MLLLLCPGQNGDGRAWLDQPGWHELARAGGMKAEGLNYRSPDEHLTADSRKGYYYPESGSHERLVRELGQRHGKDFRLAMFGYSGGAHFTHRFVHIHPERVIVWCAYSAGWWDDPPSPKAKRRNEKGTGASAAPPSATPRASDPSAIGAPETPKTENRTPSVTYPPGLILCGANDPRRAASADYFLACRRQGLPVCWAEIPDSGHEVTPGGRALAQRFMLGVLRLREKGHAAPVPCSGDNPPECGVLVRFAMPADAPGPVTAWLPDEETAALWRKTTRAKESKP